MAAAADMTLELGKAPADAEQTEDAVEASVCSLKNTWRNWLNVGAYVLNTVVTYSSLTGIFGKTNTELSTKYETLITPSGWAFSIWGPIFIWEGIFVVAQLFPRFRQSEVVLKISPCWWALCVIQCCWTVAFAQDQVTLALILMFLILASLLCISWRTDGLALCPLEYFLLRAPLSLQLGWIICASAVSVNVQADAVKSSQSTLLAIAVLTYAAVLSTSTAFAFAALSPDPIVCLVAAWAFAAIYTKLGNPEKLNDPSRFNPSTWDPLILDALRSAAICISVATLALALSAIVLRIVRARKSAASLREL